MAQVDAAAAHRNILCEQELALHLPVRETPVGPHHAMPGEPVVNRGENMPDEAGRAGIDVAVGADEPDGDRTHALYDAIPA
jgi:hypothetical protein